MRILHLSDTHGIHHRIKDMPEADVIVHSGDISNNGTEDEVLDFLNWMIELPYPHKIFVTLKCQYHSCFEIKLIP